MTLLTVGIPLGLLIGKRHKALIFWLSMSCFVEIFNSVAFLTLTPTRMAGIILFPYVLMNSRTLLAVRPARVLAAFFFVLFAVGLFYGYVSPWPDVTHARNWRYLAEGRSLIYFGSYTLEFVVALYLALQLRSEENFRALVFGLIAGASLSAFGMALERFFRFDFYYWFVHWDARMLSARPRGFNYEPRGAGYAATVGLLALLIPFRPLGERTRWALLALVAFGFHLASSVSAIALLLCSLGLLGTFHFWSAARFPGTGAKREKKEFFKRAGILIALLAAYVLFLPTYRPDIKNPTMSAWEYSLSSKENIYFDEDSWLGKFEVFDSMALNFFVQHPQNLLFGAGPGLISLPVSTPKLRIDSVPHMGVILMISNCGLLGLGLWLTLNLQLLRDLFASVLKNREKFETRFTLFACLAAFYVLQAKVFYVLALGAALAQVMKFPTARTPKET